MNRIGRLCSSVALFAISFPAFGQGDQTYPGGTPGKDFLVIEPPPPGGTWHIYDGGPNGSGGGGIAADGQRDNIDARNGNDDVINCGIEDRVMADMGDTLAIYANPNSAPIWTGTFEEYLAWYRWFNYTLGRIASIVAQGNGLLFAVEAVREEHQVVVGALAGQPGQVAVADDFPLDGFESHGSFEGVPEEWFPEGAEESTEDVMVLQAEMVETEELEATLDGLIALLDFWSIGL